MSSVDDVVLLGGDRMPALMERVEESLEDAGTEHGPELARLASETLSAGGKRLRPLLVLICGGASEDEALVRSSTAVELIHMATLVHDDVLDAALLRRGRETVFARDGRPAATATGCSPRTTTPTRCASCRMHVLRWPGESSPSDTIPTGWTWPRTATCCAAS